MTVKETNSRPTLYRARWILPVASPPIHDGELLVDSEGRIAAVAPAGAIDRPSDLHVEALGEAILLPGLVNVHAHPELAMFRGALEDLEFRDWILRLVSARRTHLREEDSLAAARWTTVEALRSGMTTIGATEASSSAVQALSEAGMRGIVFQETFGPDPSQAEASEAELRRQIDELLPTATDLVRVGVSPHAPYTVSDELYRRTARYAIEAGLPMAVHIAESRAERELVTQGAGDFAPGLRARGIETPVRASSPIRLLQTLGVLDVAPLLIHAVDLDDEDIDLIRGSGCAVAHCPIANARLGHGIVRVAGLVANGVTVGLGTDSVASNNRLDLLEEARVASLMQRARLQRPDLLPAADLLRMCTIEGARALGLDDLTGSLEPGKDADLCVISLAGSHLSPSFDPVTTLFHAARGTDVIMTVVRGRVLYRDGAVTTVNEAQLRADLEVAADRLRRGAVA